MEETTNPAASQVINRPHLQMIRQSYPFYFDFNTLPSIVSDEEVSLCMLFESTNQNLILFHWYLFQIF
jgi:hypothetical protein